MRTHRHRNTGHARNLRSNATDAEQKLWRYLRSRQLGGFKFRRQVPIGTAIVDFACTEARLIVEVDGGQHVDNETQDLERTHRLETHGYQVMRFWNDEVLTQTDNVLEAILAELQKPTPHPNPLPARGQRGQEGNEV